jgi:Protein of unknown function (DUF4231)
VSKLDHLRSELSKQIEWFDLESKKHKRLHRAFRYSVFALTGLSTALAGAALRFGQFQPGLNLVIVIATASVGVITSIEGLRKPAELWITERNVFYSLMDLKRELEYDSAEGVEGLELDKYFIGLQSILASSTEKWSRQVKPPGSDSA